MRISPEATCEPLAQHSNPSVLARLSKWLFSREQTNSLANLTEEQLRDIGVDPRLLSRSAIAEAERIGLLDLYLPRPPHPPRRR
jgi:uncharacterized protein YjiS (DUF1127 family)